MKQVWRRFFGELSGHLTGDWREPFQVAVRLARLNLPHVTQEVIDNAEALITARSNGRKHRPHSGTV